MQKVIRILCDAVNQNFVLSAVLRKAHAVCRDRFKIAEQPVFRVRNHDCISAPVKQHIHDDAGHPCVPRHVACRLDVHLAAQLVHDAHIAAVGIAHEVDRHRCDQVSDSTASRHDLRTPVKRSELRTA